MTFEYSPRAGYDGDVNEFQVSVGGEVLETLSPDGTNNTDNVWESHTITFVGTGEPMNLEFMSTGDAQDYGRGIRLDNIEMTETLAAEDDVTTIEYSLDITSSLSDTDGSETLSIDVDGLPDGAVLSAGTENDDGTWTLSSNDVTDLTVTVPGGTADFDLQVSATATEDDGDTNVVTSTVTVEQTYFVADAPELSVTLGDGVENGPPTPVSFWQMDENIGHAGTGTSINDAMGNNDGAVAQGEGGEGSMDLNDSGVNDKAAEFKDDKENFIEVEHSADLKPDSGALTIWFNPDDVDGSGERFTLASSDSSGNDDGGHFGLFIEDGELRLRMQGDDDETDISGGVVEVDEWSQVTVTWGEDGANVYLNGELVASDPDWTEGLGGNENPWTFGANQWASSDDTADNLQDFFDGHMDDIAIYDEQLTSDQVTDLFNDGVEDVMNSDENTSTEFPLDITASLTDTDGSESLAITIDGLPDGTELSAGTDNGDGTWSLESGDLDGLTMTVPSGSDDFALDVSATATDAGGDTTTVHEVVQVDVEDDGFSAGDVGTSGNDTQTGTSGNDVISGEAGDDVIDGGAGDDVVDAGQGDDLFIFGAGDGSDYFQGGDGWSDTVQLDGVDGGPGEAAGWALQVEDGVGYTQDESGITFDVEASGSVTLSDGSELTFEGVEKLEW